MQPILRLRAVAILASLALAAAGAQAWTPAHAVLPTTSDTLVSAGSPNGPFSSNKQNEPAVAINPVDPTVLVAGANDNIDMEACNAGPDDDCPFTPGVGVSGVYFSADSGSSWHQPTYQGLTARGCTGAVGDDDPACVPQQGPIGTLPNYAEHGLVADGDPAVAFGPRPTASGGFSYANGARLYYANLTSAVPGAAPFKGFEAIAVSHADNLQAAAAGSNAAWSAPVIASKQNAALFADKEQVWADNAATSPHFGNVYVCYAGFRSVPSSSQPLFVLTSRDGGTTWNQKQVTAAPNNPNSQQGFGRSGCTVRTDSHGAVYVFTYAFALGSPGLGRIQMVRSINGGNTWTRPRTVATAFDSCSRVEPSIGRCVMDGVGGARADLSPAPSVDIANGAPSGTDATNRIVMSWVDGQTLNAEQVRFSSSDNGGTDLVGPAGDPAPGSARLLLGAGDLAERHRGVGRVQRLARAVQGQCGRTHERPSARRRRPARRLHRIRGRGVLPGAPGRRRRCPRVQPEQPGGGVPRGLRLRRGQPHIRGGGVERRPSGIRLPRGRRLPAGAARHRRGNRHPDR